MLEFFGLELEALRVFLCFVIIGIVSGAQIGAFSAYNDTERKLAQAGRIVFLVLCILLGVVAFVSSIGPAIALFFTFHWGVLLRACIQAVIMGVVAGFLTRWIVLAGRRRRYMRNPIIKEAAAFCKQHHVVGVQCFSDKMRFFTAIENVEYCKNDINHKTESSQSSAESYKRFWTRPASWRAYDSPASYIGTLTFRERNYPDVPDLPMFANALAHKLDGYGYAVHTHSLQYDTSTYDYNTTPITKTVTHHNILLYSDCFVYKRKDYRKLKKEKNRADALKKASENSAKQKQNTWE